MSRGMDYLADGFGTKSEDGFSADDLWRRLTLAVFSSKLEEYECDRTGEKIKNYSE